MRHHPVRVISCLLLVVLGGLPGCGTPVPEGSIVLQRTRLVELERRGAEVKRCRLRLSQSGAAHRQTQLALATAQRRAATLEARVGVGAFTPEHLVAAGDWRLALAKVQQLAKPGGKAHRASLGKLLAAHRATVVAYWATWCKPCTSPEELALLDELQTGLARYDVALLSFAVDGLDKVTGDDRAPTWHYPLIQRDHGHLETLPHALVQRSGLGLPLFVVVDAKGRVRWLRKGKLDQDVVAELITATARVDRARP